MHPRLEQLVAKALEERVDLELRGVAGRAPRLHPVAVGRQRELLGEGSEEGCRVHPCDQLGCRGGLVPASVGVEHGLPHRASLQP
jgi:hypothetical protein